MNCEECRYLVCIAWGGQYAEGIHREWVGAIEQAMNLPFAPGNEAAMIWVEGETPEGRREVLGIFQGVDLQIEVLEEGE